MEKKNSMVTAADELDEHIKNLNQRRVLACTPLSGSQPTEAAA